jgi:hypothetical protein
LSADAIGAKVSVTYAGPTCVRASPTVTFTPVSEWTSPGTPVTYSLVVKNNNSSCDLATYDVKIDGATELSLDVTGVTMTIESGGTSTQTIVVTSSSSVSEGFYRVSANASDAVAPSFTGDGIANYNVLPPPATVAGSGG